MSDVATAAQSSCRPSTDPTDQARQDAEPNAAGAPAALADASAQQRQLPGTRGVRIGVDDFAVRCLDTRVGDPRLKAHYAALALRATVDSAGEIGTFQESRDRLARALEHTRLKTLDRLNAALKKLGLLDWERTGRASRWRILTGRTALRLFGRDRAESAQSDRAESAQSDRAESAQSDRAESAQSDRAESAQSQPHLPLPSYQLQQQQQRATGKQVRTLCWLDRVAGREPDEGRYRQMSAGDAWELIDQRANEPAAQARSERSEVEEAERQQAADPDEQRRREEHKRKQAESTVEALGLEPDGRGGWRRRIGGQP